MWEVAGEGLGQGKGDGKRSLILHGVFVGSGLFQLLNECIT